MARPDREILPGDFLDFIELTAFSRNWEQLGLTDADLAELQNGILRAPRAHPVVSGSGGLRKMRFSPMTWFKGKSGAIRVCYVIFEEVRTVLLVNAYPKSRKDILSREELRQIRGFILRQADAFRRRFGKG